jgi:hypothetical protein
MKIYVLDIKIGNSSENYLRDVGFKKYKDALKYLFDMYRVDETDDEFIQDLKNSIKEITIKSYK